MHHIMIILLVSVVTSVFATLLTLHILMNRDKKRNNKKLDNKKYIITPLPIEKAQNEFPIIPFKPKEGENNNKTFKGIDVNLFNKILLDNTEYLLNLYATYCDPFMVKASVLLIKGLTEYLINCSYNLVTFEDCRLILYDNEFKEYLKENKYNVANVEERAYFLIIDSVDHLLMILFNIFKTIDIYNSNTKKEINS